MNTAMEALDAELHSWLGTPYMSGCIMKGGGVDCRYFVVGVLDNLYDHHPELPDRLANDTGVHNREMAFRVLKQISERWPCTQVDPDNGLEGGDVIVVRCGGLVSPSHALIVGPDRRRIWHSTAGPGVCFTGIEQIKGTIVRVYRTLEQERWIR